MFSRSKHWLADRIPVRSKHWYAVATMWRHRNVLTLATRTLLNGCVLCNLYGSIIRLLLVIAPK